MRGALRVALAVWLACGSAWPSIAAANDTALGGVGGAVQPREVTDVRMAAETIQCTVFGRFAEYRVDFEFVNEGEDDTKATLGFPFLLPYEDTPGYMPQAGFRAWQDGEPLEVGYVEGRDGDRAVGYYTHEVTFHPGANRVSVAYVTSASQSVATQVEDTPPAQWADVELHAQRNLTYWVHTGRGWAGTIGRSLIRYRFADDAPAWGTQALLARRARFLREDAQRTGRAADIARASIYESVRHPDDYTYEWEYADYEPEPDAEEGYSIYDITLPYYEPAHDSDRGDSLWPVARVSASSELVLGEYSYPGTQLVDGRVDTAWAEGASNSGVGEVVELEFAQEQAINEIRVVSGYAKTPALFAKYNRPETLRITFDDGSFEILGLENHPGLQRFPIAAREVSRAKVEIMGTYRGTTRNETYLSEIQFGSSVAPAFESFEALLGRPAAPIEPEQPTKSEVTAVTDVDPATDGDAAYRTADEDQGRPWSWLPVAAIATAVGAIAGWVALRLAAVKRAQRGAIGDSAPADASEPPPQS